MKSPFPKGLFEWGLIMIAALSNKLEEKIGYEFKNKELLKQALTHSSFTNEQKIDIINQCVGSLIDRVDVIDYDGLTVDICRQLGIRHIVRGVRNMLDFENERSIADANRRIAPEIETIIIPTAQEFAHISSSAVRDILRHHGDTSLFMLQGVKLPQVI